MADVFGMETYGSSPDAGHSGSTIPDTGDLRRRYNFGDRVSELSIAQDPFFRFVSQVAKKPTDDPQFKFTEQRGSYHKRYAYVSNHGTSAPSSMAGTNATVDKDDVDAGDVYYFCMIGDYKSAGNIQTIHGQTATDVLPGSSGSQPQFFLPNSVIKVPYIIQGSSGFNGSEVFGDWTDASGDATTPDDYLLAKILSVDLSSVTDAVVLKTEIVSKGSMGSTDAELTSYVTFENAIDAVDISGKSISDYLEKKRSYVVGSAHSQGSGYPESWKDQPYSSAVGLTQIFKTAMAMDNTTRATVLKYEPNEFARIWRTKLIEHKFDIEQALLFGSQSVTDGVQYTEGAVSFITNYGNIFDGSGIGGAGSKSQDDFLDDMSQFLDPRYNNASATLFMCSTETYNWMHKLSGYFSANVSKVADGSTNLGRADFSIAGKKQVYGLDVTQVMTPYGNMNLVRNIHLDGTGVKILGINMGQCNYRPLVGNGLNRDTAVYVGVQTLENSGVDRRVDLIQTEAGMEWRMPEAHAVWK